MAKDIFVRHELDLSSNGFKDSSDKSNFTGMRVQNNILLLTDSSRTLRRCNVTKSQISSKCTLSEMDAKDQVAYVHLDPGGKHVIVSTKSGLNFYWNTEEEMDAVKITRFRLPVVISAVGWNLDNLQSEETGLAIFGSTNGAIFEFNIKKNGTIKHFKDLGPILLMGPTCSSAGPVLPILNLYFFQCPINDEKYVLLVCVPGRLYALCARVNFSVVERTATQPLLVGTMWSGALVEQGTLYAMFDFFNLTKNKRLYYVSRRDERQNSSCGLAVLFPSLSDELPINYLWATGEGFSLGRIDFSRLGSTDDLGDLVRFSGGEHMNKERWTSSAVEIIVEDAFIPFQLRNESIEYPINISLTEYHALALYDNRLEAIGITDHMVAFTETFPRSQEGKCALCMEREITSQLIWIATPTALIYYQPYEEMRNVWRYFLNQREFGKAKKIAKLLKDPEPFQIVIKQEVKKYFDEKNYVAAAEILTQSTEPFAIIVQKFIKLFPTSRDGLKRFLELKLNQMESPMDLVKRDILVIWLLDIQLSELAELKHINRQQGTFLGLNTPDQLAPDISIAEPEVLADRATQAQILREQLYRFFNWKIVLESINDNLKVVYRQIYKHNDFDTLLYLAMILKDFRTTVNILIMQNRYEEALDILKRTHPINPTLFYNFMPLLIAKYPKEAVVILIENRSTLNVYQLLPAFYGCFNEEDKDQKAKLIAAAFFYFDSVLGGSQVSGAKNKIVYNFAVRLYANFKPTMLLKFLERCGTKRRRLPYDLLFALKISVEKEIHDCCAFLYCVDRRYEEAVVSALKVSVDLARKCAIEMKEFAIRAEILGEQIADDDEFFLFFSEDNSNNNTRKPLSVAHQRRIWLRILDQVVKDDQFTNCDTTTPDASSTFLANVSPMSTVDVSSISTTNALTPKISSTLAADIPLSSTADFSSTLSANIPTSLATMQSQKLPKPATVLLFEELLNESKSLITVRDLLAYYPNFDSLVSLKKLILSYLQNKTNTLQKIKDDVDESISMTAVIHRQTQSKTKSSITVRKSEKCTICSGNVAVSAFQIFVCRHIAHFECLERYLLLSGFSKDEKTRYIKLQARRDVLKERIMKQANYVRKAPTKDETQYKEVENELRDMALKSCPFCGDRVLNVVDKSFFSDEQYEAEKKHWRL